MRHNDSDTLSGIALSCVARSLKGWVNQFDGAKIQTHPGREMFHRGTLARLTACYTESQFDRPTLGRNTLLLAKPASNVSAS